MSGQQACRPRVLICPGLAVKRYCRRKRKLREDLGASEWNSPLNSPGSKTTVTFLNVVSKQIPEPLLVVSLMTHSSLAEIASNPFMLAGNPVPSSKDKGCLFHFSRKCLHYINM